MYKHNTMSWQKLLELVMLYNTIVCEKMGWSSQSSTSKTIHSSSMLFQRLYTLHFTSPCQMHDNRLGDTLDVIMQHLPMTLGATLASLPMAQHD